MPAFTLYEKHLQYQADGTAPVDFDTDDIRVALVAGSYTPDYVNHDYFDDVAAHEVTGSNYTPGGIALTGKALQAITGGRKVVANEIVWTMHTTGFDNARYAILYKKAATNAASPLIGCADLGSNRSNKTSDLKFDLSTGFLQWTKA